MSGGGLFTRAGKGVGKGVAAEVPTEIGQVISQRHAEGKPLWNQEALDTYIEVAAAAGLVGGTVSSVGNIVGGDKDKQPDKISQLDSDDRIMAQQVQTMNTNAVNFINQQRKNLVSGSSIIFIGSNAYKSVYKEQDVFYHASRGAIISLTK